MNVSFIAGYEAIKFPPNPKVLERIMKVKDDLPLSRGRKAIYNAYILGEKDEKKIAKTTGMSLSFTGATLRDLAVKGKIKRKLGVTGQWNTSADKARRIDECLALVDKGVSDIVMICETMGASRPSVGRYLKELKRVGKIIYHPGSSDKRKAVIKSRHAA